MFFIICSPVILLPKVTVLIVILIGYFRHRMVSRVASYEDSFILKSESCLHSAYSYIIEEMVKLLQLNHLQLLKVRHHFGPDAI